MEDYNSATLPLWHKYREHIKVLVIASSKLQNIGNYAFYQCDSLTCTLNLPASLKTIGDNAFKECSGLTALYFNGNELTKIGDYAFMGCSGLANAISLPGTLTSIGKSAFQGCSSLYGDLILPNTVTSLGTFAFSGCSGFSSLRLPDNLTAIANNTFENCSGFKGSLSLPSNLTSIGERAFAGCSGLTGALIFPDNFTTLSSSAFSGCSGISSLRFPSSLSSIAYQTFYQCTGIKFITNECTTPQNISAGVITGVTKADVNLYVPAESLAAYQAHEEWKKFNIKGAKKSGKCGDNLFYVLYGGNASSDTLTISGDGAMTDYTYSGAMSVANTPWWNYKDGIKTLILPEGLTSIGNYAFLGCSNLTDSINFPEELKTIGHSAFSGCSRLTGSLNLPSKLTSVGMSAFSGCNGLTGSLNLPSSLTYIGLSAFYNCSGLTGSVNIPEGVTTMGEQAFYGCSGLTALSLPSTLTEINKSTFYDCSALTSVRFKKGLETIKEQAFRGCSALTSISLPEGLTTIEKYAFYNCSALTSISLPESLTGIGDYTFANCTNIKSIANNRTSPQSISSSVFQGVTIGNIDLYVPDGATSNYQAADIWKNFKIKGEGGVCGAQLTWIFRNDSLIISGTGAMTDYAYDDYNSKANTPWWKYKNDIKALALPEGLTSIGDCAFYECNLQGTLTLPTNLTSIGNSAFRGCSGISGSLNLPTGLLTLGDYAFYGCSGLTGALNIPAGVKSIGESAFSACTGLTGALNLPEGLTFLGESAFEGCSLSSVRLPQSLSTIESYTFYSCSALTTVQFSEGLTGIVDGAFQNSGLTSVSFPQSLTTIGGNAFYNCSSLTTVQFSEGLTGIGDYAFYECSQLASLSFPTSLTTIGNSAFQNCTALSSLNFSEGLTSIGYYAFSGCNGLSGTLRLPEGLVSLEEAAFGNCTGLSGPLHLPEGLTTIGVEAFKGCSSFSSLSFPQSLKTIKSSAFDGCTGLKFIVSDRPVPVAGVNEYTFSGITPDHIALYVPSAVLETYKAKEVWKDFNIKGIYDVAVLASPEKFGTVSGGGRYMEDSTAALTATANSHCHLVKWSDGVLAGSRNITVTQDTTLTAYFAIDTFTLTVTSANEAYGTVSGGGKYPYKGEVELTATANSGYKFMKWNDGNTNNPRTVIVTANATYTAEFAEYSTPDPTQYTVTLSASPAEGGTVIGGGLYAEGSTPTITAEPKPHYHFVKWSDEDLTNPRSITVNSDITLTAYFAVDSFTLTVLASPEEGGTVSGGGKYSYNDVVELTATANSGYKFTKWNEDGVTTATRTVTVTANATYTAVFAKESTPEPVKYTITVVASPAAGGTVSGSGEYVEGTTATLTATANSGYKFTKWKEDGVTTATRTVTVTANATYTAEFAEESTPDPVKYTITVVSENPEWGTVNGGGTFKKDTTVTIKAYAFSGYKFVKWKEDGITTATRTITVTANATYTAVFAEESTPDPVTYYTITVKSDNEEWGMATGGGNFKKDTTVTIKAQSFSGYKFMKWKEDGNTEATRQIKVTADATYTAVFADASTPDPVKYTITVVASPAEGGTVSGGGVYVEGSTVTLTATANSGYKFVKWSDGKTDATRTVTVTADATYTAEFAKESEPTANEAASGIAFTVYPNPSKGLFTVEVAEPALMEIYNTAGIRVMSAELSAGKREVSLRSAGIYFLRLSVGERSKTVKLIVR